MQTSNPQLDVSQLSEAQASPLACAPARKGGGSAEGIAALSPLVIRGESLEDNNYPDGGENFELVTDGKHIFLEAHPQPKSDGVANAAITDFLNCTFSFNCCDLTQMLMQLETCLGNCFVPAVDRGRPLHFYEPISGS